MSSTWVDFRELRAKLRFVDVLKSYNVELKVRGDRATGFCPLPAHKGHSDKRRSPSFSAQLARGMFQCFGCGAKGNVLDFAAYMDGIDPDDSHALREVALRLQNQFHINGEGRSGNTKQPPKPKPGATVPPETSAAQQKPSEVSARPVIVNAPLDFTLKMLDAEHPYLKQRGFTTETISYFGLGYCSRGLMQGRIAIPLHDHQCRLVGYAGRLIDDDAISEENPKYRFPSPRERDGKSYEFHKSQLLYHGHAVECAVADLIVVEGFPSVWWLWQCGMGNVVALMGSSCSQEQAQLIASLVSPSGRVWVLPDADAAGERCAQSVLSQVCSQRFARWVKLEKGQPTEYSPEELRKLLALELSPAGIPS